MRQKSFFKATKLGSWFHRKTKYRFMNVRNLWAETVYFFVIFSHWQLVIIFSVYTLPDLATSVAIALFLQKTILKPRK